MTATVEEMATLLARSLMDLNDLRDWHIHWGENDEFAGRCYMTARVIVLNRRWLLDTAARNIRETILHEIAHALTDQNHTLVWQAKLIEIGGELWWGRNDGTVSTSRLEM